MIFKFLLLPFFIGILSALKIKFIGELFIGELIACIFSAFNIAKIKLSAAERTVVTFSFLWAFAQLLSDFVNNSEIADAAKGIFAPLVFIVTIIFLVNYASHKFERIPSFLLGITIGGVIQLLIVPTEYFLFNFWKWGFGNAILGIFVIYFSFFLKRKKQLLLYGVLTIFLIVTLYFDARSMAFFPFLAALAYTNYYGKKVSTLSIRFSGVWASFKIILIVVPAIIIVNIGASALFSSEVFLSNFSLTAAAKYRTQATGSYGILLGGRSEILVSAQAFLDKPFLGHGSWAKDTSGYLDKYAILRSNLGYSLREDGGYEEIGTAVLIPAHSFIMGALVWAGVLGGLFWLIVLNITFKSFIKNLNFFPLYYYVGMIGFVWNLFFSPFGAESRWNAAVFLGAFFSYLNYLKFKPRIII